MFGWLFCGGLAIFFWGYLFAMLVLGQDRIKAATREFVTNPLIRGTVNLELRRAIQRAPFSVVYHFHETNYTATARELKVERSISFDEIKVAYRAESVFCLFKGNRLQLKAVIHIRKADQRRIVEAFLKRNHVEMRELDACSGEFA
ncbi:MAG: hypothetical protein H8E66_24150 [Planctomycetes bacterium]|nr:hypothetical protein [Planctomycetota bacterium]